MRQVGRYHVVCLLAVVLGGCATRQPSRGLTDTFVTMGESKLSMGEPVDTSTGIFDPDAKAPPLETLEVKRPAVLVPAATSLEDGDPELTYALAEVAARPSPAAHRRVAGLYRRHHVLDTAYDHLLAAERLDPNDAATHDSIARLWRAWGLEEFGLGAAYRAVYLAPESPQAHNTLGTILQSVGHYEEARRAYGRALSLAPMAAYVLNNMCYLDFREGAFAQAIETCQAATCVDPSLAEAHNNLALAYFATGRDELAWKALQDAGPIWNATYNLGVAHMARGNHEAAAAAFAATSRVKPNWMAPRHRAEQAHARSLTGPKGR